MFNKSSVIYLLLHFLKIYVCRFKIFWSTSLQNFVNRSFFINYWYTNIENLSQFTHLETGRNREKQEETPRETQEIPKEIGEAICKTWGNVWGNWRICRELPLGRAMSHLVTSFQADSYIAGFIRESLPNMPY